MKQTGYILIFMFLSGISAWAQTFTGSTGPVPDYGPPVAFYITVPALDSARLNSSFGLKKICIDISHPRVSDLAIYLAAPDGTQIDLVDGAGGSDSNFTGTCFSMSASVTIFSGTAPFTGTYYPRHNIGELNDGQSGIGVWRLIVQDLVRGDSGVVNSWGLTFDTVAPVPRSTPQALAISSMLPGADAQIAHSRTAGSYRICSSAMSGSQIPYTAGSFTIASRCQTPPPISATALLEYHRHGAVVLRRLGRVGQRSLSGWHLR
jgi:subtilisin-like proprotein convertase family protein